MELLFNIGKTNHYATSTDKYIPNYDKIDFTNVCDVIREKMSVLGYTLNIQKNSLDEYVNNNDEFKYINDNRYCRVVLRYHDNDEIFDKIDDELYYHMKLNGYATTFIYDGVEKIYSIVYINNDMYRISFLRNI